MSQPPTVFYLLYGEDDIAINAAVKQLRAAMGDDTEADLNTSEFDGDTTDVAEILGAARSFPFLADKRLVIVRGLISHLTRKGAGEMGKKALERLIDSLPELPDYTRLVLVERGNLRKDSRVVKLAQSDPRGYCKEHSVPKDLTEWIIRRAREAYETDIDAAAAHALASVVESDLRRADNELIKLVSYVNGEHPITETEVALLTPYVAEASAFDLVDALAAGNSRTALTLIHRVLDQDPSDPGFRLFSLITRQFRLLLLTREYLSNGGSANKNALAQHLGIHPYPASKLLVQSRAFSVSELEDIYRQLQKMDQDIKTGRITIGLALDLLAAGLSRQSTRR